MATSLNTFWDQLIDVQSISHQLSASQLLSSVENINKVLGSVNFDAYSKVLKTYDTLEELYRTPGYLDTSFFTRQDVEDCSNDEVAERKIASDSSTSTEEPVTVSENTRADDINIANEQFCQYLESQTDGFISTLIWTDFEDGMENEITRQVGEYMERNRYVTFCWLNRIFNSNREKPTITSALLRTLLLILVMLILCSLWWQLVWLVCILKTKRRLLWLLKSGVPKNVLTLCLILHMVQIG